MSIERIILSGGGTGGHIYPALAIYKKMKAQNPNLQCLYIGTERGLESKIIPEYETIDFKTIEISGLKRSLSLSNLKVIWQMLVSTRKARKLIEEFQPDIVIGTGGFVCAPVLNAAAKLGIPTIIHEQNSVAGITNKFLARKVDKIATSFKEVHRDFSSYAPKLVFTGNPRGQEVLDSVSDDSILEDNFNLDPTQQTVLIFGGSRGAPAINEAAINAIPYFAQVSYQVIIGTGNVHYDEWMQYIASNDITIPDNVRVVNYIENIPSLMNQIDLVVSRSGATTLAEITTLGLPSILIPSPYVTNNHQEKNAQSLVNQGAAIMIREEDLTQDTLYYYINQLMTNPEQLTQMAEITKRFGTPHAIDDFIKVVDTLIK